MGPYVEVVLVSVGISRHACLINVTEAICGLCASRALTSVTSPLPGGICRQQGSGRGGSPRALATSREQSAGLAAKQQKVCISVSTTPNQMTIHD